MTVIATMGQITFICWQCCVLYPIVRLSSHGAQNRFGEIFDPDRVEMRLCAPVTRGYFFLLGALRLVNAASPRNIDQKKISSGIQGTRFHESPCDRVPPDYKPLPAFRSWLNYFKSANFHGIVLLSKAARSWKLGWSPVIESCRESSR